MGLIVQEGRRKVLDAILNLVILIVLSIILMYAFWATMQIFPDIKEAFLTGSTPSLMFNPFLSHGEANFLLISWGIMVFAKWFWKVCGYPQMLQFGFQMIIGWIVGTSLAYACATAEFETMQVLFGARVFVTVGFFCLPPIAFFACLLPYREYLYRFSNNGAGQVVQGAEKGTSRDAFYASDELLQRTARKLHESRG
jgi:hypothetical protein